MKRNIILLFSIGLLIITSCTSTAPQKEESTVRGLTVNDIKAAISNHQQTIIDSITSHSSTVRPGVAVLDIASEDNELGVFTAEEIILQLVRTRQFRVVDRDSIETILKEHHFQYSGIVSDETAVSIGKFIGASVIITGVIRQREDQIDFTLKILDVETAEIIDLISIPIWE